MKEFLKKYKFYILAPFVLFAILTILLILFSMKPQNGPFIYQIH